MASSGLLVLVGKPVVGHGSCVDLDQIWPGLDHISAIPTAFPAKPVKCWPKLCHVEHKYLGSFQGARVSAQPGLLHWHVRSLCCPSNSGGDKLDFASCSMVTSMWRLCFRSRSTCHGIAFRCLPFSDLHVTNKSRPTCLGLIGIQTHGVCRNSGPGNCFDIFSWSEQSLI